MTCDRMASGPDYTVVVMPSEQALAKLGSSYEILLGFCAPTQTKVGCFDFHPPCVGTDGANYAGVCLIGSKEDTIEGEPGSAYPGETRTDGLCVTQEEEVTEAPKSVEAKMDGADVTVV